MIGQKQRTAQADWMPVLQRAYDDPDRARAAELVDTAVARVREILATHTRPAFGWSGGKDSQGLRAVMELAGVEECYLAISALEYPAFLAWATEYMPDRLSVELNARVNLRWLAENSHMLFPGTKEASRWFQLVQGNGRRRYAARTDRDVVFLGRRTTDGNVVGPGGSYVNGGVTIASPIHDWSHEDLLCVLGAYQMPLPPCYWWPRGFQVGTGSWAARQFAASHDQAWAEVYEIDPAVVHTAATEIQEARDWLESRG